MIKIIEDGMEFVLVNTGHDRAGNYCKGCSAIDFCTETTELQIVCGHLEAAGSPYICTSATPVQNEAKVYGPHNFHDASRLVGKLIEAWVDGKWYKCKLESIVFNSGDVDSPYKANGCMSLCSTIREIPTRRLTQAQIIEAHPDLEGVELVGGWE